MKVPAVGVAADPNAGRKSGLKEFGIVGGVRLGVDAVGERDGGAEHDGGAMALFKAEDELSGSHAGGAVEFELSDDAAFDLGRVAVGTLAFAVAQLIGNIGGGRSEADGRQNYGDFRHDLESGEVVCIAGTELRSALIGIAERDAEAGAFQHVWQGRGSERRPVLTHYGGERVLFVYAPIDAPVSEADGRVVGTNRRKIAVVGTIEVSFKVHFKLSGDGDAGARIEPLKVIAEPSGARLDVELWRGIRAGVAEEAGKREIIAAGRRAVMNKCGFQEAVGGESDGPEFDRGL